MANGQIVFRDFTQKILIERSKLKFKSDLNISKVVPAKAWGKKDLQHALWKPHGSRSWEGYAPRTSQARPQGTEDLCTRDLPKLRDLTRSLYKVSVGVKISAPLQTRLDSTQLALGLESRQRCGWKAWSENRNSCAVWGTICVTANMHKSHSQFSSFRAIKTKKMF